MFFWVYNKTVTLTAVTNRADVHVLQTCVGSLRLRVLLATTASHHTSRSMGAHPIFVASAQRQRGGPLVSDLTMAVSHWSVLSEVTLFIGPASG